jgi:hypothetical protein
MQRNIEMTRAASNAFRFVLTMGVVNLFADVTYEGGASINGPFLGTLGASAAAVSIIAGVGEFLGYSLRSVAGYVSDKTGRYWLATFIGYGVNLLAVPAMALAGAWPVAAGLVLAERVGRAIRKPTVDSMLSYTTGSLGRGWVYAVNTALDETGATVGPLLIALVLFLKGSYRTGYALLLISAPFSARDRSDSASRRFYKTILALHAGRVMFRGGIDEFRTHLLSPVEHGGSYSILDTALPGAIDRDGCDRKPDSRQAI